MTTKEDKNEWQQLVRELRGLSDIDDYPATALLSAADAIEELMDKLDAVPAYAHYFSVEALRLRIRGDMVGTPMTLDEWLDAGDEEEEDPVGFG